MNKKAITILGAIFLLIVGTLGFLVYSKYSTNNTQTTQNTNPTPTPDTGTTPTPEATPTPSSLAGIVQLESQQIISPVLFFNGSGIDYFDNQGNLYQASLQSNNGQIVLTDKKQLSIPPKSGITKVLWPQNGQDFIVEYKDLSGKKTFSYFNYSNGTYTDLPSQVTSVSWMPDGKKILYVWLQDGKASLSKGDPDTKNYQKLADLWETDDEIHVSPDSSQVLYYQTNNTSSNNFINSVSIDGKVFKGLVKNGQNYGVLWSPDGQKFLFGKKNPSSQAYELWVYNLTSGDIRSLNLSTTVDKAVWDGASSIVYAAVPNTPSQTPDALTVDSFYKIDVATLEKKQYGVGASTAIDGQDLLVSPSGDKLYFKNGQDGGLYYLDLTQ